MTNAVDSASFSTNQSNAVVVNNSGQPYAASQSTSNVDNKFIDDSDWIQSAFLVSDSNLEKTTDSINRYWSTAYNKFTDTSLGGSLGINARPQFTPYSDIPVKGRVPGRNDVNLFSVSGNHGLGRYYSEAIDDNAQTIYLRMGVPQYSSLMTFFGKAFDDDMSAFARTGKGVSVWFQLGNAVGTVASFAAFPALSMTILAGRILNLFFSRPTSKFYTLKPTMHMYWSAVNMLVNTMAINRGIMPRFFNEADGAQQENNPWAPNKEYMSKLNQLMPDIFTSQYGYDAHAVANKAQRRANALFENDYQALNQGSETDYIGFVNNSNQDKVKDPPGDHSLANYLNHLVSFGYYSSPEGGKTTRMEMDPKQDPTTGENTTAQKDSFLNNMDADLRDGNQFAIFKVDHTGSVSEAFSNSVVESDLSNKFNGVASQVREARFSFADGNFTDSVIGDMIKGAVGTVTDIVSGVANGATMGVFGSLKGLMNAGYIDIPKHWQSSSASLPHSTYTMQLISPYGNALSQMQNIFFPLAMIMAATLPLSTGSQSYTSPFLVQIYDRGRCQIQLGMIDSLSITRGTCNLPFSNRGKVMAIDVSFSVVDLSSIMHMPISSGGLFQSISLHNPTVDEDNILMDYLAVLGGQDIYSQIYTLPKAKLNMAKRFSQAQQLVSPAYWAGLVNEETPTGLISWLLPGASTLPRGN